MEIIFILLALSQKQFNDQPIVLDATSDPYASEFLFVTTQHGVYTFDRDSEKWTRITRASGLPNDSVTSIGIDEGIVWVATPSGLVSADVHIQDWQTYSFDGMIEGMCFDDDYVWIAGDFGLKRFDKFLETWEDIATLPIQHLILEKQYIWLATDSGVKRYNKEFEKIETVPDAPVYPFDYIVSTPNRLWFFGVQTFTAYEKTSERWSVYHGYRFDDIATLADTIFAVHEEKIVIYDPQADTWLPYRELEDIAAIRGIDASGDKLYLATTTGLVVYGLTDKKRETYNQASGLKVDNLVDAFAKTEYLYAISEQTVEYLTRTTGIWQAEDITPSRPKREQLLFFDDAGAHARLIKNLDIRLKGRAYYTQTWTIADNTTTVYDTIINLQLIAQHSSNRLLSLYYDNTDPERGTFGFGYRGLERDLLYRCNGGILRTEFYEFDVIPEFSDSGLNAKFRYKTHGLNAQGGYLQSRLRNDFFYGKSSEKELSILDINYQKNRFYRIYSSTQPLVREYDTIYVDDRSSATNTIGTRTGQAIAAITGDFDVLVNGLDYHIDYQNGVIHFIQSRDSNDIIVLLLNGNTIVIQSDTVTGHVMENVYYLGPDIIPRSLTMTITDTLGQLYALSVFGLDANNDGSIDPEHINHDLGYLEFPHNRPFPDAVYDSSISVYTLDIEYQSFSVFYYLSHSPVLRMSEKVYVDGVLMERGADYVLDYTSGTLLFLREELVTDFSEVDVQYSSLEKQREDLMYSAQTNVAIGSNVNIAPGYTHVDDEDIVFVTGKFQTGQGTDGLKFIPQIASNSDQEIGQAYSLIGNYKIFSLNAEYRGYTDQFEAFGLNIRKHGTLRHSGVVSASIEPVRFVRVDGQFKKEIMTDSAGIEQYTQYLQGRVNYLNPSVPNGYILMRTDDLPQYDKQRIQANVRYNLELMKTRLKLSSTVSAQNVDLNGIDDFKTYEYSIDGSFSLPFPVHGNVYFRKIRNYEHETKYKEEDEIRGNIGFDMIPGVYYTSNYNLYARSFLFDAQQDMSVQHYFYNNVNIAPGRWYAPLSTINISGGLGTNFDEYVRNLPSFYERQPLVLNPLEDGILSSINHSNSYYAAIQLMPFTNITIWGKHTLTKSGISYYSLPDKQSATRDEVRIEFEPKSLGLFTVYMDYRTYHTYPCKNINSVFFEWNKPWSALIRTKYTTNYWLQKEDYNIAAAENTELRTNLETLLQLTSKSYITFDVGGARQEDINGDITFVFTPGAGINLNLFSFLYVQCNYESNVMIDSTTTHTLSAKITGQF